MDHSISKLLALWLLVEFSGENPLEETGTQRADRNQCRTPSASFLHSPRGEPTKVDRESEKGKDGGEVVIHEPISAVSS